MTKEFLSKRGVSFISKDVGIPSLRSELRTRGFHAVPVTFIDGQPFKGYNPTDLSHALGLPFHGARTESSTPNMPDYMNRVLSHLSRTMLSVPDNYRLHSVGGGMTLLTYPHYVARHVKVTMAANNTGIWDHNLHARNQGHRKLKSNIQVAKYIDGVRNKFNLWLESISESDLSRICNGHYGQVTLSRLIEISLMRAVFALERIRTVLINELGIEPQETIPSEIQKLGNPALAAD